MSSHVQQFLTHNNCIVKKDDRSKGLTHTLLDGWKGGKVNIPDDKRNDFCTAYARDVTMGNTLFVNELRGHYFKMFLDLDIMHDQMLSDEEIQKLMSIVYDCFKRFFTHTNSNQFLCVVSDACPKSICTTTTQLKRLIEDESRLRLLVDTKLNYVDDKYVVKVEDAVIDDFKYDTIFELKDGRRFCNTHRVNRKLKHGIHAIFPNITVSQDEALYMREALLSALNKELGTKYAEDGWSQVVDNAVYVNSGLRMIYSSKTKVCEECKGRNNGKYCNYCTNGKDLNEGRPYIFKFVCNDGQIDNSLTQEFSANMTRLIQKSSIYTANPSVTDGWKRFDGCPSFGDVKKSKSNGIGAPKLQSKERIFDEEKKNAKKKIV